ncbi:glycosyltransferase [Seonamhaeicola maritimus]|uniref:Glycosyltransferase n=1 Tax=Seonamhaeicola maritimus TaxID=2591822 RepID=A0A5C7GK92_9FLAO|nr:glycosyltransferase [Seonamhaeicola maritimus]TXG38869.1 glycosyltransferase [Seonamhaeicola maritimus]
MNRTNQISVIVPTYNRAHILSETLNSVLAQTYSNLECIVVDDGSTDNTEEIVNSFSLKDKRVKFYKRPGNYPKGANACRQYGYKISSGRYINWLDSDDVFALDKLELQIEKLLKDKGKVCVANGEFFNTTIGDSPNDLWAKNLGEKNTSQSLILQKTRWATGALLWDKSAVSVEFWDTELQGGQEWLFHILSAINIKQEDFVFIREPLLYIRNSNDSITRDNVLVFRYNNYLNARVLLLNYLFEEDKRTFNTYFKAIGMYSLKYIKYLIKSGSYLIVLKFLKIIFTASFIKSIKFSFGALVFKAINKDYFLKQTFKKQRLYVLSKEWARHGKNSGYQRIINYFKIPLVVSKGFRLPYKLVQLLKNKTNILNYRGETVVKELVILFNIFRSKKIHVLYGDMDYYFLHYIKKFPFNIRKNTLVATFHHPTYELERRLNYNKEKVLGALDKIIVMGPNQTPFFKLYTNAEIRFIPHGINTNQENDFKPVVRQNQILLVGTSHRDHKRNIEIMEKLSQKATITFVIIMFEEYANQYAQFNNAILLTHNVSDKDLYYYYKTSKGLLMSLKDCTASNAILEAMVYKCPLIINDVGAVKDYIPESSGVPVFSTDNIKGTLEYIEKLIKDEEYLNKIVFNQKSLVEKYNWNIIAEETEDFIYWNKN